MAVRSSRHQAVLEELAEWWEDISETRIGSRVVLLEVPPGWGGTTVLAEFAATVADPEGPVTISVSIDAAPAAGQAIEAKALSDALLKPLGRSRLAQRVGLDTPAGKAGLALGVGGLFVSGLPAQVSLLLAPLAATAAQNAWDASPAGQQGVLARTARAVAAVSAEVPVAVLLDDADRFDPDLVTLMIDHLASRLDGQVLVVAAVRPGSELAAELRSPDRYGLVGRVVRAEADPDMSAQSRTELARELLPGLPDTAAERIGQRTTSFGEVFTVAGEDKLTDAITAAVRIVDTVIDAIMARGEPSVRARVLAWAGGVLTERQAEQALLILDQPSDPDDDPDIISSGGLVRLRDPASSRVRDHAGLLSTSTTRKLAAAVLQEAVHVARNPGATLTERTVARLAAHRIRAALDPSAELTKVQCLLIRGLEQLGDPEAAYQVAAAALAELPRSPQAAGQRAELLKAWLRLARTRPKPAEDPLTREAIDLATASGAMFGLEARVWAAVNLLRRPGRHDAALSLADQVTTELNAYPGRDAAVNQWRLLLAFHAGQAGYPATAQRLLAPIIGGGSAEQRDAAQAVLRALDGPRSDIRLQIIILEAELDATPAIADEDRLRLHHALAWDYRQLGGYTQALQHGTEELSYRRRLQRPTIPTSWPLVTTSPAGQASTETPRARCSFTKSCCPT
jgi:tetratricopeptide (TPR) repeat protein